MEMKEKDIQKSKDIAFAKRKQKQSVSKVVSLYVSFIFSSHSTCPLSSMREDITLRW